jgi:uncharacterized membrane protein YbaN (DUF454 family)
MRRQAKRAFVFFLALVFLALGLIGLVLPFLQGILFLTISFFLLSMLSPRFRDQVEHQTRKWPKFHAIVVKAERYIERFIGDVS